MNNRAISLFTVAFILILMIGMLSVVFVSEEAWEEDASDVWSLTGNRNTVNMLILGKDSAAGLCDVIMLVSMNFTRGEVNIMQIPRDTYLNYTENDYKKLNGALNSYGSSSAFANALSDALGIDIDYYFALDLAVVEKMVDMLSGIEVDVPVDMDYEDKDQNLSIHLRAGKQTLGGKEAVQFLRYRSGYATGDLGRIDAQKLFISAFGNKMSRQKNPVIYYNLTRLLISDADTNFTEQDLVPIILKGSRERLSESFYMTAPGEAVQSEVSGAWYYVISKASMHELLRERFGNTQSAEKFDAQNKFVDNRVKSFYDIYNKRCEYRIYSADEIENNLININ